MQVITRLWRAGTVGRAAVVFVALLLGCCMLGALGSLLTPSTTRQRTASEQPTPTILSGSPSVAAPTTAPSTEPPPATAQPTLSASPTLAPSIIPTAPPAPSPIPTVLPTPSPVPSPTSAGADIPAAPAAAPGGSPSLVQPAGLPTAAVVEGRRRMSCSTARPSRSRPTRARTIAIGMADRSATSGSLTAASSTWR